MNSATPARPAGARRRLPKPVTTIGALLLAALLSLASAQIGDPPTELLEGLADYAPVATEAGDAYTTVSDFTFRIHESAGVAVSVSGEGALNDANMRFLGTLVGVASGYGEGIAGPVSDFFRSRAADLTDMGEVPIEVMEYLMYVDVTGEAPAEVSVRVEPQVVAAEEFGPPAHALGPADARYVVREFTDLQCPYCAIFAEEGLPLIEEELLSRGDVRFEIHHFPLKSIHPNAVVAAEAAECVAEEAATADGAEAGEAAFWTFQDALFAEQSRWAGLGDPVATFVAIASENGLAAEGLGLCVRSGRFTDRIEASYRNATQVLRLTGTPTIFVDGLKLGDYRNLEEYLRLMRLSDALAAE